VYARRLFQSACRSSAAAAARGRARQARRGRGRHDVGGRVKVEAAKPGSRSRGGPPPVGADAEKSTLGAKIARVHRDRIDPDGPRLPLAGPESFVVSVEVNPSPASTPGQSRGRGDAEARRVDAVNTADGRAPWRA